MLKVGVGISKYVLLRFWYLYSYQGRVKLKEDHRDESNIGKNQHTNFTLDLIGMINDRFDKNIFEGKNGILLP